MEQYEKSIEFFFFFWGGVGGGGLTSWQILSERRCDNFLLCIGQWYASWLKDLVLCHLLFLICLIVMIICSVSMKGNFIS